MKKFLLAVSFFLTLTACQSTKDALTLKKKSSADEFLVEKKSPLVLPPNYGDLPLPDDENTNEDKNKKNDIKVSLGNEKLEIDVPIKNSKPTSLERSILEKIK